MTLQGVAINLAMTRLLVLMVCLSTSVVGQACPTGAEAQQGLEAAEPSTLHGQLIYHDDLRQWSSLRPDRPVCGQDEIQLIFSDAAAGRRAEAMRGCSLTVKGKIFNSPTGYYSTELAMSNPTLDADSNCRPFPVQPDLSKVSVPRSVGHYRVLITVDFRGKGHVSVRVTDGSSGSNALEPWQAYAHFMLNGAADVIWFECQEDFQLEDAKQQPPGAAIDAGGDDAGAALQNMNGANTITYSCRRKRLPTK